jgi:hypothetical protein
MRQQCKGWNMKNIIFVIFLVMSFPAISEDQWYDCDVHQFYVLGDDGRLEIKSEGYEGEMFRVNRDASIIIGDKINTMYNVDVVASNPINNGVYSLINYSRREDGQIRRLSSLTVQDYGMQKPFVLAEGNYIFTGICK